MENGKENSPLDAKEQQMREEIRILQEKRANILQREVDDLKKQKEKALSKVSKLEEALEDLRAENKALCVDSDTRVSAQLELLEEALLREQEDKDELVKKLQMATKQNGNLALRLSKVEGNLDRMRSRRGSRETISIPFLTSPLLSPTSPEPGAASFTRASPLAARPDGDEEEAEEGTHSAPTSPSTNSETGQKEVLSHAEGSSPEPALSPAKLKLPATPYSSDPLTPSPAGPSPASRPPAHTTVSESACNPVPTDDCSGNGTPTRVADDSALLSHARHSNSRLLPHSMRLKHSPLVAKHYSSLVDLTRSGGGSSPGGTASNTPSMKTKRYVLATTTKREASVQTTLTMPTSQPSSCSDSQEFERALECVSKLEMENQTLAEKLAIAESKMAATEEKYVGLKGTLQKYKSDLETVRGNLSEAVQWSTSKMEDFQEDLDVARIVYSLHGSLSQESTTIGELCSKLKTSQTSVARLDHENNCLRVELGKLQRKHSELKQKCKSPRRQATPPVPHPSPLYSTPLSRSPIARSALSILSTCTHQQV